MANLYELVRPELGGTAGSRGSRKSGYRNPAGYSKNRPSFGPPKPEFVRAKVSGRALASPGPGGLIAFTKT